MRAWAWWLCNAVCVVVVVLTYWRLYEASVHMATPNKGRGWQDKRIFQYGFNKGYGGDRDHLADGATTSVEEVRFVPKASECHKMVSSHNARLSACCWPVPPAPGVSAHHAGVVSARTRSHNQLACSPFARPPTGCSAVHAPSGAA
jgi:hypothetical protein